jgi:dephospho-CoA kinase
MRIAITGGICSGKSSICKIIKDSGYFVFNSDDEAKILANTNLKIKEQIITLFGTDSYVNDIYNTSYVRNIVFNGLAVWFFKPTTPLQSNDKLSKAYKLYRLL